MSGPISASVPISTTGWAAGLSQRRIRSNEARCSAMQPAVGPPTQLCRKIADPGAAGPETIGPVLKSIGSM